MAKTHTPAVLMGGIILVCGFLLFSDYEIMLEKKGIDPEQEEMLDYFRKHNIGYEQAVDYIRKMKRSGHGFS